MKSIKFVLKNEYLLTNSGSLLLVRAEWIKVLGGWIRADIISCSSAPLCSLFCAVQDGRRTHTLLVHFAFVEMEIKKTFFLHFKGLIWNAHWTKKRQKMKHNSIFFQSHWLHLRRHLLSRTKPHSFSDIYKNIFHKVGNNTGYLRLQYRE